jgi:hypothetical protein
MVYFCRGEQWFAIAQFTLSPAISNSGSSADVPLEVEKTYPINNGVNNHKDGPD